MVFNAINHKPLPIYGHGQNIRDWLYVEDHCRAIALVLFNGKIGSTYNIGGGNQPTNLEIVTKICTILDELLPKPIWLQISMTYIIPQLLWGVFG